MKTPLDKTYLFKSMPVRQAVIKQVMGKARESLICSAMRKGAFPRPNKTNDPLPMG